MEHKALWIFIGITLMGTILAVVIGYFLTNSIMQPINVIYKGTQKLAGGDLSFRIDIKDAQKEIATLGHAFNFMASSIKERDEQLLKYTKGEIMKSERLAMIGRLAASVAHEINNPLGGILLFSGLLIKKAPPDEKFRENLERIEREAKRCQYIVQGLLDFAREREPKKEIIDINDVVEKTIMLFVNQPMFQNITVIKNYQPDISSVFADHAQIQQVFVNIILNSVDAMGKKGVLTITTRNVHENDVVEIHFTDTGLGMTEEQINHIFEPFYTTKSVGDGSGLGLSISYGIIQGHDGNIKVVSAVNEGSSFIIQRGLST